jgi:hypothetical protein
MLIDERDLQHDDFLDYFSIPIESDSLNIWLEEPSRIRRKKKPTKGWHIFTDEMWENYKN